MPSPDIVTRREPPAGWQPLADEIGSFYHQPGWIRALGDCYGFPAFYLTADRAGAVEGALALLEVPALLGPTRLVSLPFSYAAGPVARDPSTAVALMEAARTLAAQRGIRRLEIKQRGASAPEAPGFSRTTRYSTYRVPTEGGEADVWKRLHASSTQRSIKKARKSGLEIVVGAGASDWARMAELEEETAHRHGLPAPPRHFFVECCEALRGQGLCALYLARTADGQIAAGIVVWQGPREWIYAFGASRPRHLELRPNHLLIWEALRRATAAGVTFDLGRAAPEQAGLVEFKTRWGGEPVPLAYDYWPEASGLNVARRDGGALGLAAKLWSRLPAAVARRGSFLYRYLG